MKIKFAIPLLLAALIYVLVWNSNILGWIFTPLLLLVILALLLIQVLNNHDWVDYSQKQKVDRVSIYMLFAAVSFACYSAYTLYSKNPIDIAKSDIIPLIHEVYYKRFVEGSFVYDKVVGYDYEVWTPNYLPMHWIPFVPAYLLGFDPRWVAFAACIGSLIWQAFLIQKMNLHPIEKRIKSMIPFVCLFSIQYKQQQSFSHTIELLVVGYYLLLALSMLAHKYSISAVGFILTLLSRYVSVFFAPIYALSLWYYSKKQAIKWAITIAIGIVLLYGIPFLSKRPTAFAEGALAYDIAALGEWDRQSWQAPDADPYQLFRGYGIAAWVYKWHGATELSARIAWLKYLLVTIMGINALIWCVYIFRKRPHASVLPAILMWTMGLFFTCVLVPYDYLFWSVLFLAPAATMHIRWFHAKG